MNNAGDLPLVPSDIASQQNEGGPQFNEIESEPARRTITLTLTLPGELDCFFWVGLFRKGQLSPKEIYGLSTIEDILQQVAEKGLQGEAEPVMISDTSVLPPRFVYLVPANKDKGVLTPEMIGEVTKTLKSWSPEHVGIYLAPELCAEIPAQQLLHEVLQELIRETNIKHYYLLAGRHGTYNLLNTALKLKFDVEDDELQVFIFH